MPTAGRMIKNYQPTIYYAAGLKETGSNSGYHGSALKSSEQC